MNEIDERGMMTDIKRRGPMYSVAAGEKSPSAVIIVFDVFDLSEEGKGDEI